MAAPASFPGARPQMNQGTSGRADSISVVMKAIKGVTDPKVLRRPFRFQCPPTDTFTRDYTFNYTDYDTVGQGQRSRPAGRQLARITFNSLFVDFDPLWATWSDAGEPSSRRGPLKRAAELVHILNTGTPFELIVGQSKLWGTTDVHWGPHNDRGATLRQLTVDEKGGEPDARYVNVQFTEWRDVELTQRGRDSKSGDKGSQIGHVLVHRDTGSVFTQSGHKITHIQGEATLEKISKWAYGSTSRWRSVAKANGLTTWTGSRGLIDLLKQRKIEWLVLKLPTKGNLHPSSALEATILANADNKP